MNEMKEYICNAKIMASPMNRGDYNIYRNWTIPANEDPNDEGFLCLRQDGSESWVPRELFLNTHVNDVGKIQDGYHTFDELYEHRHLLWINLLLANKDISFKTRRNFEGEEWEGWFIAGIQMPDKQITYHIPVTFWGMLSDVKELERNFGFDGHTGQDVIERLTGMATLNHAGNLSVQARIEEITRLMDEERALRISSAIAEVDAKQIRAQYVLVKLQQQKNDMTRFAEEMAFSREATRLNAVSYGASCSGDLD
jgi:hypothetical protein